MVLWVRMRFCESYGHSRVGDGDERVVLIRNRRRRARTIKPKNQSTSHNICWCVLTTRERNAAAGRYMIADNVRPQEWLPYLCSDIFDRVRLHLGGSAGVFDGAVGPPLNVDRLKLIAVHLLMSSLR